MQRRRDASDIVYHGYRRSSFDCVIAVESADGELITILPHLPWHSPTGMNWGYAGAGPHETARSLLIDALGPDAICPACQGTGRVTYLAEGDGYRPKPFDPQLHPQSSGAGHASARADTSTSPAERSQTSSSPNGTTSGP